MFFHMKKYIYSESLFNTLYKHWNSDKAQILKKFPSDKIDVTKCTLSVFYYKLFFFYEFYF